MAWKKEEKKEEFKVRETNYISQHKQEYRETMLFRYSYLFLKPEKELTGLELGLKWFLIFKGYDSMHSNEDAVEIRRKRSIENDCDALLQRYKIPYTLIESYAIIERNTDRTIRLDKKHLTKEELDIYT